MSFALPTGRNQSNFIDATAEIKTALSQQRLPSEQALRCLIDHCFSSGWSINKVEALLGVEVDQLESVGVKGIEAMLNEMTE